MSTVSKEIADRIAAGEFPEDRAVMIVKYTNSFNGGDSYGVIFKGDDPAKYRASPFVIDPVVYWRAK
jgi:hypothetical protein